MKTCLIVVRRAAATALLLGSLAASAQGPGRVTTSFDPNWRFLKADAKGAEQSAFVDAKWRTLAVPHDWSIEGPYDQANPMSRGGGYLPAGVGWYRKSFSLATTEASRRVRIEFDGVMANSDVWINGFHLGQRPYGYSSFSYDLTGHLKFGKGQVNVLAVRADNSVQPASRYYTGAGIYRHVRLVSTAPVHFGEGGVYVAASPVGVGKGAAVEQADIKVQAEVVNQSAASGEYVLQTSILDPDGRTVSTTETKQTVAAGKSATVSQDLRIVKSVQLWSPQHPGLYKAVSVLRSGKAELDNQTSVFGIREATFDAAKGFVLNGVPMKIKGVCLHHDAGGLGAAVPLDGWRHRLEILKQAGVNGIRTAHNPVAPEFLDLCDQMGFLVMDETFDTWTASKNNGEQGYNRFFTKWWEADTRAMVLRDRNHPSIVIYSVGNEIHDNLNNPEGFQKYKMQQDLVHQLDPTRPVTMALFRPGQSKVYENGFVETMDVVGQNYRENELVAAHLAKPERKVIGTENGHSLTAWLALRDHDFMAGQFLWAGFDYLGENDWPGTTSDLGLFDRIGGWKPIAYQRQSWWSDQPVVHLVRKEGNAGAGPWVANWTPTDFDTYDAGKVEAYSNADEVELFLNGTSLGKKTKPADDSPRAWDVTFAKGTLRAVARNKGQEVATDELKTAGPPARIVLTSSRSRLGAAWDDAAYITARVVDANGVLCPNADNQITFTLAGAGMIAAVDNGNVNSHEGYQTNQRKVYQGQCVAIVKAKSVGGPIAVKASAPGLTDGTVTVETGAKANQ